MPFLSADEAVCTDAVIVERKFRAVYRVVTELAELLADDETLSLLGNEEGHTPMAGLGIRIGLDEQRHTAPVQAIRYPGLRSVDDVFVAIPDRYRTDGLQIGTTAGFGECQRTPEFPTSEPRQVLFALSVGTESFDASSHDQMRVEDAGRCHPGPRDTLDDLRVGRRRQAQSAVLPANRRTEQSQLLHLLDESRRIFIREVVLASDRLDLSRDPGVDAVEDLCLVFRAECFSRIRFTHVAGASRVSSRFGRRRHGPFSARA